MYLALAATSATLASYPPVAATVGPMLEAWAFLMQVILAYALYAQAPGPFALADVLIAAAPLAALQGLPALGGSPKGLLDFYVVSDGVCAYFLHKPPCVYMLRWSRQATV